MSEPILFYRCCLCHRPISPWDLEKHMACPKCGHAKISPTNLTFWEKVVAIVKRPKVWQWRNIKIGGFGGE